MTLELPPDVEGALAEEARRKGTTSERLVLEDLRRRYPAPRLRADTMTELFAKWETEDPVLGPEDAAARQREGDELMAAQADLLDFSAFGLSGAVVATANAGHLSALTNATLWSDIGY